MNDFLLPASISELFAVFGINDSAQMLILLLSSILGVLLVLIVLIAFGGRPARKSAMPNQSKEDISSVAEKPTVEPVISVARQTHSKDASASHQASHSDASAEAAEQVEDFQIFTRPKQKSRLADQSAQSLEADAQMSTEEHLRLIEKEMVRLRDLFQGGHITRDMYIDETRSLYHQACGLSSVS